MRMLSELPPITSVGKESCLCDVELNTVNGFAALSAMRKHFAKPVDIVILQTTCIDTDGLQERPDIHVLLRSRNQGTEEGHDGRTSMESDIGQGRKLCYIEIGAQPCA